METMIDLNQCNDDREANESAFKSVSAPTTPTSQNRQMGCLTRGHGKGHHRVQFPEDNQIVTGYFDAPNPYQYVLESQSLEELIDSYQTACDKQNIKPIPRVLQQLKQFNCNTRMRAQDLILRGERLDSRHCEALEEILKRVLFRLIDLDSCDLDCEGASALFDCIEWYECATHLCIANNKSIGVIGWQSLCRTLKKTSCLQYLNLRNTGLNEQILLIMGRAMRLGSHLATIHLENAGLYGRRLAILVAALKLNTNLRELYLGDNKICSADGVQIGNLLRANTCLDVLDLRRNHIQDIGLDHICEGLSHQPYGGLKILNLSDNQITSRAMNHLSQSLTMCRSLIGLDLSQNSLTNEGISILKEGLLSAKTLKYLNLSATNINCEGAIAIAEVIADNQKIMIVDLSDNTIKTAGLMAVCLSMKHNTSVVEFIITETIECDDEEKAQNFKDLLQELNGYCGLNKSNAIYDESNELLTQYIESPLKDNDINEDPLDGIFTNQTLFSTELNEGRVDSSADNPLESEMKPDVISHAINGSNSQSSCKPDIISIQESLTHGHHKPIARTVSLGSWGSASDSSPHKTSGRFSVSPVHLDHEIDNNSDSNQPNTQILDTNLDEIQTEIVIDSNDSNKENNIQTNTESINETTDQLMDLPKGIPKIPFLTPESVYNKNIRRMSSPNLNQTVRPKVQPLQQFKQYSHLESLDLKSSLPISPTFFRRFEFPDPMVLKLPPEVDEIISKFVDLDVNES